MTFIASLLTALISALVVLNARKLAEESKLRLLVQAIATLIGIAAIFSALQRALVIVPTGSVGIADFQGNLSPNILNPGFHATNPFAKVVKFSTRLKDLKEGIEATSKEGLAFNIDVSLQYRLDPQQALSVYRNIGEDETEIVISQFRSVVREITASYPAEPIYSSKRQEIASQLHQRLKERLTPLGFIVEASLLREVKLPETLQAAVQQKLKAEQESQQMVSVIEKERQEAERKRIEARGIADYQKIVSEGLSDRVLQLKAIEATEKLSQSANSKVVVVGGQGSVPFMIQTDANTPKP